MAANKNSFERRIETLLQDGYRNTDPQFSIAHGRGRDLISGRGRLYLSQRSDPTAVEAARRTLGDHAVLRLIETGDDFDLHSVPRGSRALRKTLAASPYEPAYMESLRGRAHGFIDTLNAIGVTALSGDAIGVRHIALTHNGIDHEANDDVFLTVVPPIILKPQGWGHLAIEGVEG